MLEAMLPYDYVYSLNDRFTLNVHFHTKIQIGDLVLFSSDTDMTETEALNV